MKYVYGQDKLFELTTFIAKDNWNLYTNYTIIGILEGSSNSLYICTAKHCTHVLRKICSLWYSTYYNFAKKVVGKYYVLVDSSNFLVVVFPKISFSR